MKKFGKSSGIIGLFLLTCAPIWGEESSIKLEFSGATTEENQVTLQGAGFGQYPQANVSFGYIPTDNAFDGATDGQGAIVTAKPGEGVMVFGQRIVTNQSAMIRCSIRTDQSTASVILATIGDEPDVFVSQNTPSNKGYFTGQYLRLQTFCTPPSTGFQPVIQILNTSKTDSLTAYIDNLEVYLLDPNRYTSNAFLDGDETDPPTDKISIPAEGEAGVISPGDISVKVGQIDFFMEMVLIPAGTFIMGSTSGYEAPQHQVTISQPFYIGKYEVTQEQWKLVMNSTPSYFGGNSNYPVEQVSWNDCQSFIQKLNQTGQGTFRLPTEAEWEYACRAGTTTAFYWGEDSSYSQIGSYSWYLNNSGYKTHEVGSKLPNNWGLYDMNGNVWEWCQDMFGLYSSSAQVDPTGSANFSERVHRGGGFSTEPGNMRSTSRNFRKPDSALFNIGFRVVLVRN